MQRRSRALVHLTITPGMVDEQLRGARIAAMHGSGAVRASSLVASACDGSAAATRPEAVVSKHV